MYCRLDDICKNWSGITYNRLIIIVIKSQCPFCGKSLRVVPINSEEYCPHCGCKIEQEHKKIQVCRIQKYNMKCEIERMEIIYTFYFFAFLKKWLKNYWHFVTGKVDFSNVKIEPIFEEMVDFDTYEEKGLLSVNKDNNVYRT